MGCLLPESRGNVTINQEDFARFLRWLDPDPERAGERYERIRRKLVTISSARGGSHPEEMADECIDLVVKKVPEIASTYSGEPEFYFYSVIKFVVLRWLRKSQTVELYETDDATAFVNDSSGIEKQHACLDGCLAKLDAGSRELALEYYRHNKKAKIDHRWALAQRLGVTLNALRIKALRIRQTLELCVQQCMDQNA